MLLLHTKIWPFTHAHTIHQDADGRVRDIWDATAIRITELALTPDFKYLVALGMEFPPPITEETQLSDAQADLEELDERSPLRNEAAQVVLIVYDFATKQTESYVSSSPLQMFDSLFCPLFYFCQINSFRGRVHEYANNSRFSVCTYEPFSECKALVYSTFFGPPFIIDWFIRKSTFGISMRAKWHVNILVKNKVITSFGVVLVELTMDSLLAGVKVRIKHYYSNLPWSFF